MKAPHHYVRAAWARISDACCRTHGEQGAFEEAVRVLEDEYEDLRDHWRGEGARLHLVLYVERPEDRERGDG